jgi:membrane protein insertase Oxa1/YidC/SpoIIIJ
VITPLANIFQPLIDALESVMLFFHDNIGFGWGFSIIFLTLVVRRSRSCRPSTRTTSSVSSRRR